MIDKAPKVRGVCSPSEVLRQLSLDEKASLTVGADGAHTARVTRLGIPPIALSDGPHGLRWRPVSDNPVGKRESLPATCFPTACAIASSWNPALLARVGGALAWEAHSFGVAVILGPGVNIKRSPLCGRNFEYFSEDPLLAGRLGAAWVEGVQARGVGACVKHFAVHNQETERVRVNAQLDERTLREIYLPAFEHIVTTARPWMVMCSYNKVNGTWASENHLLLTEILREEWGFDGVAVSDWGSVGDRVRALAAGLDLEMPRGELGSDLSVVTAVTSGEIEETILDTAVERMLRLVDRAPREPGKPFDADAHHELALEAARESIILLKNARDVLPLSSGIEKVAVIGEFARSPRIQGAGSSAVSPTRVDSALESLREIAPRDVEISFHAGFALDGSEQPHLVADAVAAAEAADVQVIFLGLPAEDESEGWDREHIMLPPNQLALLEAVAAVSSRVAVVLTNGSAVSVAGVEEYADAIVEAWLPGQAGGRAIAEILWGDVNPSGKLAETIPCRLEDCPSFLNFPGELLNVRYGEGVFVGYRGHDAAKQEVAYPFGHGLSYTTFAYDDLRIEESASTLTNGFSVDVTFRVTNTGNTSGAEVAQVYLGGPERSAIARPPRELRGFQKVFLEPGKSATVTIRLPQRSFAYWRPGHGWWVEAGTRSIQVGASSRDIRCSAQLVVEHASLEPLIDGSASLDEWLADPWFSKALRARVGVDEHGKPRGIFANPAQMKRIGGFPVQRLAEYGGLGFDPETVDSVVRQARDRRIQLTQPTTDDPPCPERLSAESWS